jgi:regulator of protease activity HflC (stomatin/prohibitin superfamily)
MNAVDPLGSRTPDRSPVVTPHAGAPVRQLGILTVLVAIAAVALWVLRTVPRLFPWRQMSSIRVVAESPLPTLMLGALLLVLAGLAGATIMARARQAAGLPATASRPARRWPRIMQTMRLPQGDPAVIGRSARWPQAGVVGCLAMACLLLLRSLPQAMTMPGSIAIGAAAIALCFPLLVAERHFAAVPASRNPEAAGLHALFLLCIVVWTGAGLVQIALGLGIRHAGFVMVPIAVLLGAVAVELGLRAMGRCFLPPPSPSEARAAIASLLASVIADGVRGRSIAVPMRRQFGIDISRSWALSYVRDTAPHVALLLLLIVWGLSGVVLVGIDQRAVYERFGAPVAVLHPGLHVVLPWPMGHVRRVAFGTMRETALTDVGAAPQGRLVGAEDRAPPDADRLWEQPHPSELTFLVASSGDVRQSFQVVSADLRLLYRIGLTDTDALQAAYRVDDPEMLLRATAGRVLSRFFASRTPDEVLGGDREAMAEWLRAAVQRELTRFGCGIELTALVIEAIHPPAGAAEAYHGVQAAQIMAATSIAAERGRAIAELSKAGQYATGLVMQAQAAAAETTGAAQADLTRFNADHAAAEAGGEAFIVNRYLTDLSHALSREQVIIVDHRIPTADAPIVDLRPPGPATPPETPPDRE